MNKSKLFRLPAFLMAVSMLLAACGAAQPTAEPSDAAKKGHGAIDVGDAMVMFDQAWMEVKGRQ